MGNAKRKARRDRCWANGQKRKDARRKAAAVREALNKQRRQNGEPTPWEVTKAKRAAAREPKRLDYLLRQMGVEIVEPDDGEAA